MGTYNPAHAAAMRNLSEITSNCGDRACYLAPARVYLFVGKSGLKYLLTKYYRFVAAEFYFVVNRLQIPEHPYRVIKRYTR